MIIVYAYSNNEVITKWSQASDITIEVILTVTDEEDVPCGSRLALLKQLFPSFLIGFLVLSPADQRFWLTTGKSRFTLGSEYLSLTNPSFCSMNRAEIAHRRTCSNDSRWTRMPCGTMILCDHHPRATEHRQQRSQMERPPWTSVIPYSPSIKPTMMIRVSGKEKMIKHCREPKNDSWSVLTVRTWNQRSEDETHRKRKKVLAKWRNEPVWKRVVGYSAIRAFFP